MAGRTPNDTPSPRPDFERIRPTPVTPGGEARERPGRARRVWPKLLTAGALAALLALLAAAWWRLSELLEAPSELAPPPPEAQAPAPAPETPAADATPQASGAQRAAARRERAGGLADTWAEKRGRLEQMRAERWAADEYAEARRLAETGAARYQAQDYAASADAYREAIDIAERLLERAPAVLDDALQRGRRALDDDDAAQAKEAFSLALAVDPDNEAAKQGVQHTERLQRAQALLRSAREHERAGELSAARADYREALGLHEALEAARAGLGRVEQALAERTFRRRMSEGLAAIERGEYRAAREALEAAREIRPDAPEVADGLARVEAGLTERAIAAHREQASALEREERWQAALAEYEAALALDPTLAFAQAGRERAAARAELDERLQFHIERAQRLQSAAVRSDVEALLAEARAAPEPGPRLRRQVDELSELLQAAQTPVPVELRSDDKTSVVVYRVGQLGTFESKELRLLPGEYTAIGRCPGYRDVRREFRVVAGEPAGPIEIRCKEKI